MADRTKVTKECDKGSCRKREGVRNIRVTVETWPLGVDAPVCSTEPGSIEGATEKIFTGELCPAHIDLAHRQAIGLFHNTKTY